jgi:aspartate-semialdehyde dehydrogenase
LLYARSAATVKTLVMELGGHAPVLVFADADLDRAVAETIKAKFATSGQDCLGANRILVERPVYDAFCAKFTRATQALTVGPGLDDPDIGPLMNEGAVAKQEAQVTDAVNRGARLLCGGKRLAMGPLYYAPTVLADVPCAARIFHEETFGPVAAIAPFDSEDQAVAEANDTEYGLVAYLHSSDPRRI